MKDRLKCLIRLIFVSYHFSHSGRILFFVYTKSALFDNKITANIDWYFILYFTIILRLFLNTVSIQANLFDLFSKQ